MWSLFGNTSAQKMGWMGGNSSFKDATEGRYSHATAVCTCAKALCTCAKAGGVHRCHALPNRQLLHRL